MSAKIVMVPRYKARGMDITDEDGGIVDTVSRSRHSWHRQLSPFILGPCNLYDGLVSRNMENGWQYSKVYREHVTVTKTGKWKGELRLFPYFHWACSGWNNPRAVRYPMGKGVKPLYSYWDGECLNYIEARKRIYGPLYAEAVQKTDAWRRLKMLYRELPKIFLLDYDVYDTDHPRVSYTHVLNNPARKMGHAFVLAMLLTEDPALNQMELR